MPGFKPEADVIFSVHLRMACQFEVLLIFREEFGAMEIGVYLSQDKLVGVAKRLSEQARPADILYQLTLVLPEEQVYFMYCLKTG